MPRYPGGLIRKTPVTPAGPFQNGAASGVWTLADAAYWTKQGLWPTQGVLPSWIGVWGDSAVENFNDIAIDSGGNLYATGDTSTSGVGSYATVKYNSLGVLQWQRRLSDTNGTSGYGVCVDSSGNVYLTGDSYYSMGLIKYDTSGTLQYQQFVDNGNIELGYGGAIDSSANFYAVGQLRLSGVDNFIITKTNSSGAVQWQRYLGIPGNYAYGLGAVTDASNVYVCGNVQGIAMLAAYSLAGTLQWQRKLTAPSTAMTFNGCATDGAGSVYAVGREDATPRIGVVVKYNSSGVIQWQRKLSGVSDISLERCAVDASGNLYASGTLGQFGTSALIVCYNSSGVLQWQRTFAVSGGSVTGRGVTTDASGTYYLCGSTSRPTQNGLIARLPTSGTKTGTYALGGASYTYAASSLTEAAATYTDAAGTMTNTTISIAPTTSGYTAATTTLTSSVVTI